MALAYNSKISELPVYPVTLSGIELYPIAYLENGILANDADKYNVYRTNTDLLSTYIAKHLKFDDLSNILDDIYNTIVPLDKEIHDSYGSLWSEVQSNRTTTYAKIGAAINTYNGVNSAVQELYTYTKNYDHNFYMGGSVEADGFYITYYNNKKFKAIPLATNTTYGLLTYDLLKNTLGSLVTIGKASEDTQGVISYAYIRSIAAAAYHKVNVNTKTSGNDVYLTYNFDDYLNPPSYSGEVKIEHGTFKSCGTTTLSYLGKFAETYIGDVKEFNPTYFDLRGETEVVEYEDEYPMMSGNTYGAVTYSKVQEIARKSVGNHTLDIRCVDDSIGMSIEYRGDANNPLYTYTKQFDPASNTAYGVVRGDYVYTLAEEIVKNRANNGFTITSGSNGSTHSFESIRDIAYTINHKPSIKVNQNDEGVFITFGMDGTDKTTIEIPKASDSNAGVINSEMIKTKADEISDGLGSSGSGVTERISSHVFDSNNGSISFTLYTSGQQPNTIGTGYSLPKISESSTNSTMGLVSKTILENMIYSYLDDNAWTLIRDLKFKLNDQVTNPKFYLFDTEIGSGIGTFTSGSIITINKDILELALRMNGVTRLMETAATLKGTCDNSTLTTVGGLSKDLLNTLATGLAEVTVNWNLS